jgi:hypothetical protein
VSWVSIYDLSDILNNGSLTNQVPNLSTLGTSFESLIANAAGTARNPFEIVADTLSTNGDQLVVTSVFTTSSWTSATQLVRLTFNGNALNTPLNIGFSASNVARIEVSALLTRVNNTTISYQMTSKFFTTSIGGAALYNEYHQDLQTIAGLDLAATAYNIDAQGDSAVIGDITCKAFQIQYIPKIV